MRWRVYYEDCSSMSSEDYTPGEVDPHGVIVIVQWDDNGRRFMLHEKDWYFWSGHQWYGCDVHGLIARLLKRAPVDHLLQGWLIATEQYREVLRQADIENKD